MNSRGLVEAAVSGDPRPGRSARRRRGLRVPRPRGTATAVEHGVSDAAAPHGARRHHGARVPQQLRDWCAERANFPTFVVESAPAQVVKNKTEAAYFRSELLEQRRSLMDTWAAFVTTPPEKKVVQFRA